MFSECDFEFIAKVNCESMLAPILIDFDERAVFAYAMLGLLNKTLDLIKNLASGNVMSIIQFH
jgi:hypothetical protein